MNKLLVLATLIVLLLISCTKEKEQIQKLKTVKLTKLYTIEGYPEGADSTRTFSLYWNGIKADVEGNILERSVKIIEKENFQMKN